MTAVPVPHSQPRTGKRSVPAALLLGAAGAALVLLAGGRTWSEGTATAGARDTVTQQASGQDVTALPGALAIVGLAALVAVFAVRGAGRTVVSGLLALSGAGVVAAAVVGLGDTSALEEKAAKVSGLTRASVADVGHTAWPWVAVAGGVLLLLAGLLDVYKRQARGRGEPAPRPYGPGPGPARGAVEGPGPGRGPHGRPRGTHVGVTRPPQLHPARRVGENDPERSPRPKARHSNEESTHVG